MSSMGARFGAKFEIFSSEMVCSSAPASVSSSLSGDEGWESVRRALRESQCLPVVTSLPKYFTLIFCPTSNPNSPGWLIWRQGRGGEWIARRKGSVDDTQLIDSKTKKK